MGCFSSNYSMNLIFSNLALFIQHGAPEIFFFYLKALQWSWVFTQRTPSPTIETLAHPCLLLLQSQQPGNGTSPDVHQHAVGLWKCGTYTQWALFGSEEKWNMQETDGCEKCTVKQGGPDSEKTKTVCFPSSVDLALYNVCVYMQASINVSKV